MNTIAKAGNPKKGLVYFGNALHALEDFYAHTNFVELALMKVKGDWVFPWVDVNAPELVDYNCEGKRFEVKNEREIYHDFKRYPEQGEIDFFDRNGFIKTLTKQEINILHSKFRNKKSKGEDVVFSYLGITGGVSDTYVTPGLPEAGVKYWKLYYEFEGIRYLIKSVEKRREIIKSSLFGLGWVDWNTYRDVKAELHLVPNSKYNDEVVVRAYNNKKQQTYEHIPLVTGLFRGEDAMYSIEDKLLSFIETEAFTLADFKTNDGYSIPGAGKGSKYVLSAVDYMVMLILEDLAKKQDSEADRSSKHVGKKASEYIKNYKTFIEYRATIFTVIDSLPKVPKYIAEVLLNSMKKMAMNLVKGMLRAMVIGNMKEFKASQNVKYKLGTNPTHTQIAKDSPTHPFHGLAAELAKIAVQDIGSHVHDYLFSDKALTIEDIKRKTEEYFSHPKDIDWMDITVYKWLAKEMAKKPGMITRFNHWVAKSWDVSKEDLEKLIQQDHDMFGVPYDKNKYKEYLEDSEAYQKQLEASGNAKSKVKHNHGDHHDHDDEACDEHDKKADEDFFKEIKEKMDAQEEVFIEDMNLSEQWIEHYLNKIEVVLKESSDDIKKIMSVFEKSKDISAFVEDLKFRPDGMSIEDIEAKIEERLEDLKASFINYSKMKLKEKFKD